MTDEAGKALRFTNGSGKLRVDLGRARNIGFQDERRTAGRFDLLIDGETLATRIRRGRFTWKQAVELVRISIQIDNQNVEFTIALFVSKNSQPLATVDEEDILSRNIAAENHFHL